MMWDGGKPLLVANPWHICLHGLCVRKGLTGSYDKNPLLHTIRPGYEQAFLSRAWERVKFWSDWDLSNIACYTIPNITKIFIKEHFDGFFCYKGRT